MKTPLYLRYFLYNIDVVTRSSHNVIQIHEKLLVVSKISVLVMDFMSPRSTNEPWKYSMQGPPTVVPSYNLHKW